MPSDCNPSAEAETPAPGPLPIPYTADEVGRTFAGLLTTLHFAAELSDLGIGRFNPLKRRAAKRHLRAICIALWHIALGKSFPNDADAFFRHFLDTYPPLTGDGRGAKKLRDLVLGYSELMARKKDADFTWVADELVNALRLREADPRSQRLRLSLRIRGLYELIFAKLI